MTLSKILGAVLCAALAGCTTSLRTEPDVYRSATATTALEGIPYSLPMQQYDIVVTRTLSSCPEGVPGAAALALDPNAKRQDLSFSVTAEATPLLAPGEHYLIDYRALSSPMKTSSFAIEHHEKSRTLKSINVSADDKTDEVVKAVTKTALSVASIVSPVGAFGESPGMAPNLKSVPKVMCSGEAVALLAASAAAKSDLKTKTALLAQTTDEIAKLALLGATSDVQKDRLFGLMQQQQTQSEAVEAAKKTLAKALESLSITHKQRWPLRFDELAAESPLTDAMQTKLGLKLLEVRDTLVDPQKPVNDKCEGEGADLLECVKPKLATFFRLEPIDATPAECNPKLPLVGCSLKRGGVEARDGVADAGIFVRPPVEGRLVICSEQAACDPQGQLALLRGDALPVPQLGQLRFLPFENRMLQNNQLVVQLRENGMIEKFEYQNKASAALRAASAASDVASQIEKYYDERRADEKQAVKDARELVAATRAEEVAVLQQQITMLTKEKELNALQNPSPAAPDPMKEAQLELVRAQIQSLLAQAELARRTN